MEILYLKQKNLIYIFVIMILLLFIYVYNGECYCLNLGNNMEKNCINIVYVWLFYIYNKEYWK